LRPSALINALVIYPKNFWHILYVISKLQSAFIKGRQIQDPILIANKCLESWLRSGEPSVICKMDLKKAYDHVNLDFLLYMLRSCGFGVSKVVRAIEEDVFKD
jgi:hypothetical protein